MPISLNKLTFKLSSSKALHTTLNIAGICENYQLKCCLL